MFGLRTLAPIILASFAVAQSHGTLEIEAIEAHFNQSQIIGTDRAKGNLISSFEPTAFLNVTFPGVGSFTPGQKFTQDKTAEWPIVSVTAANSSTEFTGNYTIIMVDAGPIGNDIATQGTYRHWLFNSVTVGDDNVINNSSATVGMPWFGPAPPAGSGSHRYVFLLYQQPSSFTPPEGSISNGTITTIQLDEYLSAAKFGPLVAGTYMQVEEGTASASVASTQAVVTSTLPAARSTGSASGSGGVPSGSASASATGSGNGASQLMFTPLVVVLASLLASLIVL